MQLAVSLLVGLLLLAVWLSWRLSRLSRDVQRLADEPSPSMHLLQREVQAVRSGVDDRLREHFAAARELGQQLGRLEKAAENVEQLGAGLSELQSILRPPQLRGAFGERMLEDLLADALPRDRFRVQYTYPSSGVRVDAVVLLGGGRLLPIDSKFPLDNFRRYLELRQSGKDRAAVVRRAFARDVKRHVDDISAKYVSADDGTLDVAFMYIPSESVFREVAVDGQDGDGATLAEYAIRKRVVPVSPNTLHAYLSVVRLGLQGFQLQSSAREIVDHLTHLDADVRKLRSQLGTAVKQTRHSLGNLNEADDVLRRIEARLSRIRGVPA